MTPRELVRQAALENARWCDLVCGGHGAPGEMQLVGVEVRLPHRVAAATAAPP